ncbi:MAG TPA: S41 family peptidase [Thermoanaerobaculia bacterium]|nr:S41 family peptidase [Thermoanaerobaculia bacterium]
MRRLLLLLALTSALHALPHDPAVSRTHIAFVHGGQVWVVPRAGGRAVRVTDTPVVKANPRFSPDGQTIAFVARDLYTVPLRGGAPKRITSMAQPQGLCQWTADGRLLFFTNAQSFSPIEMQLFTVPASGGTPTKLPPAYGSDGALSGDRLAYTPQWPTPLIAHWKRYRGGAAPDIRLLDLRSGESSKATDWIGPDLHPMFEGTTLYYVSDRGPEQRLNLWSQGRQLTHFRQYDVRNPSTGPGAIVFQLGAGLQLLDLKTGLSKPVHIELPAEPLRREVDASRFITNEQLSADGSKVLYEARGDLWVDGTNLTNTSGVFEREASWSPDGQLAWWSDATGEYQLYIDGRKITDFADGFRYRPVWSADSRKLAFVDQRGAVFVSDLRTVKQIDKDEWGELPELAWQGDAPLYTKTGTNRLPALFRDGTQITSSDYAVSNPANGFYISYRNFDRPVVDWIAQRIAHRATGVIMKGETPLPTSAGSITSLAVTADGNPLFGFIDANGARSIRLYAEKEQVIAEGTSDFSLAADGRHLLFNRKIKVLGGDEIAATAPGKMQVVRKDEWRQLFNDAWRFYRDYFYAPKAPLGDWAAERERYAPMLEACVTREEVNDVLAEMIGEASVGHAYVASRGDVEPYPRGELPSENEARYRDWVAQNRARVEAASGGRIGYIHIPTFTTEGYSALERQLAGQVDKEALIIDPRWSQGGWTGGLMAELLARPRLNAAASRYSDRAWPVPRWGAHFGPKALLVNHMVVSAGENFALYFRMLKLGPIIGTRTWGGLTGLNGTPALIDGGAVNVPNAPFFDAEGGFSIEGHGIDPDVVVEQDPAQAKDAQLEAAIKAMLAVLR